MLTTQVLRARKPPASWPVRRIWLAVGVAGLFTAMAWRSQETRVSPSIVVRPAGTVTADAPGVNHAEPWLAVDPRDASHAMAVSLAGGGGQSVAYTTFDGGNTWRRATHSASEQSFPGGDPIATFAGAGTALFATINPFRVWRSRNGGLTWQGPAIIPGRSYDREYLAVRSTPNAADTVYALAKTPILVFGHVANDALALARSTDAGTTFEAPRLMLPDPTTSIIHVPGGLVVAPNGDLLGVVHGARRAGD